MIALDGNGGASAALELAFLPKERPLMNSAAPHSKLPNLFGMKCPRWGKPNLSEFTVLWIP
jgi:hypothetical protein